MAPCATSLLGLLVLGTAVPAERGAQKGARVARAWRSPGAGENGAWPEDEFLAGKPSVGICLSGGGSRAYSASMGVLRALQDLGVLQKARYLSGVSGGSWALSAYTYVQSRELSDEELLGPIWEPEATTMEQLAELDERSARFSPTQDFKRILLEEAAAALVNPWRGLEEAWERTVDRVFLEPLGARSRWINKVNNSALFSWSNASRDAVIARNPSLADKRWLVPQRPRPYPILCTTFLGPKKYQPQKIEERFHVQSEVTPLYAGVPHDVDAMYRNRRTGLLDTVQLGGLVEPLAYSSTPLSSLAPEDAAPSGELTVTETDREFTLARGAAESSFAPGASLINQVPFIGDLVSDKIDYYSPSAAQPSTQNMVTSDGGASENSGIYALLRRGVNRIIMSYNPPVAIAEPDQWDPNARLPVFEEIDDAFACLWGIYVNAPVYNNTQIFPQETFAPIVTALQRAKADGRGAVTTVDLTTVENTRFGIPSGMKASVTIVYSDRLTSWEKRLPADVRAALETEDFPSWPHYPTSVLTLQSTQINALASMMGYTIRMNAKEFADIVDTAVLV